METPMKASDVMTPQVVTVSPDAPILEAARLMLNSRISGLPVVDSRGRLTGIVTEGDFLRRAETGTERRRSRWLEFLLGPGRLATDYVHSHGRKIEEVMTADPRTVSEDTPLEKVVHEMERNHIKRLPVMRGDQLVGIISRANLIRALASLAREAPPPREDDQAIRERILAELDRQPWKPAVNVVVRKGQVDLSGFITDHRQRQALKVAVENVPGVKAVHDHVAFVEPTSGAVVFSPEDEAGSVAG
jgi:CBS domain-containing protein